jgi:hypothetical protein
VSSGVEHLEPDANSFNHSVFHENIDTHGRRKVAGRLTGGVSEGDT